MPFGMKNGPSTCLKVMSKIFQKYLDIFMKIFLDDFIINNDMETFLQKPNYVKLKVQGIQH